MQIIVLLLIIFIFFSPNLGSVIFILVSALLELWIILANLTKIKVKNEDNKYTTKEVEVIEHYRLFFKYPVISKMLSPIFSTIQLSVFVLVPWLLFKGLYINAIIIGLNYFITTQLAVILNPQFFLHDNLDKGKIKDPIKLLRYKQDMDAIDSAVEKMHLNRSNISPSKDNLTESSETAVDPLINDAIDIMIKYDRVATSLFQRKLSISYDRATEIMDTLARSGLISPRTNSDPSYVLVTDSPELEEIKKIFSSLPKYDTKIFKEEQTEYTMNLIDRDSIYPEVKEFVKDKKQVSAETLQKKFDIGYARAARIMDHLGEDGLISEAKNNNSDTENEFINKQGRLIEMVLEAFGIRTRVVEINTKKNGIEYCFEPEVGSSIKDLPSLDKDIALAVASPTGKVKIQAPIPGKSLIGITIPIKIHKGT